MNMTATGSIIMIVALIVAAVVLVSGLYVYKQRQSQRLKTHFGAEYNRTVRQFGDPSRAEAELRKRETRVAKLTLRPLTREEAAKFSDAWNRLQGGFVDDPRGTVAEADRLVTELMTARGYPMSDFERRAADISVDHPTVVEEYRAAQGIAAKSASGTVDTEALRKAIVHYRTLFADLLEVPVTQTDGNVPQPVTVR